MKTKLGWTTIVVICLAFLAGIVSAQSAPQLINYQGRLANSVGMPLADGSNVDLTFKFYSAASGGTLFLTVLQEDVLVTGGLYNVLIGSGTVTHGAEISLANVFRNHSEVWLGVAVDAEAEMTPRSRISSVPYALNCGPVDLGAIQAFLTADDYDGDGFDKNGIWLGDDCDDSEARVYPGAPEVCDGIDNQCPGDPGYGLVDEGCGGCEDLDGDGYGWGCAAGPDCDDLQLTTYPGAPETCGDGIDNQCPGDAGYGFIDEGCPGHCTDLDADNYFAEYGCGTAIDCNDLDINNWSSCATCSDLDGDNFFAECDLYGTIDGPDCDDLDLNNWTSCATCADTDADDWFAGCNAYLTIDGPDCDDLQLTTYPGAPETCWDGLDNQCPGDAGYGTVDEGCPPPTPIASIPAGCFNMGDAFSEGYSTELPVHNVCLPSFNMDVYEVTNAAYAVCVSGGGCTAPRYSDSDTRGSYYGNATYDNFPVINVNWNQATAYCAWAGKRLPTEAEWEYAARGGLSGKRYPWGDTISGANANFGQSGDIWDDDTSPVGNYAANGYGLYDMSGNVWECVNDWYLATYYTGRPNPDSDPAGPNTGTDRIVRGGSYFNAVPFLRVSFRGSINPSDVSATLGFRCAGD